ncbi:MULTISPECIES: hypothetical protein [Sphingobium]|uniref:hypothetical protein n=1 Tax=Sphingobium TaxID=165695 RepID=UPI0007706B93|nr:MULTISPECIES: hypothetical protein [unclassified Sphingobium]AMK25759.1 hypothetical protein K426_24279 [Sphingobium sp. TKS]MEC6700838.1 hypothetical protein [Sphingobium sp. SJ10-10]NML87770.1 hypothetical protein [Sphingobium sp. TB-6]
MDVNQSVDNGDKALIILQSLIFYLREKNILSRCDIEELCERVESRSFIEKEFPCDRGQAVAAAKEMRDLNEYCGKRYGGKRRRCL